MGRLTTSSVITGAASGIGRATRCVSPRRAQGRRRRPRRAEGTQLASEIGARSYKLTSRASPA